MWKTCRRTPPHLLLNLLLTLPESDAPLTLSFPHTSPTPLPWQHLLQYDVVDILSEESLFAFSFCSSGSLENSKHQVIIVSHTDIDRHKRSNGFLNHFRNTTEQDSFISLNSAPVPRWRWTNNCPRGQTVGRLCPFRLGLLSSSPAPPPELVQPGLPTHPPLLDSPVWMCWRWIQGGWHNAVNIPPLNGAKETAWWQPASLA